MKHIDKSIQKAFEKEIKEQDKYFQKEDYKLRIWVEKNFGKRCRDFQRHCPVCEKWRLADMLMLSEKYKELNKVRKVRGKDDSIKKV